MINIPQHKNEKFIWRKISQRKFIQNISFIVGAIILISVLSFVLFPDPFIKTIAETKLQMHLQSIIRITP